MVTLDDIRAGLAADQFFLDYLPTMWLADGRCVGCESLVRWRRPTGVVPPNDFIPLIDNTPVAEALTCWVVGRVAADLGDWLRANEGVHVGINIPPEVLSLRGVEEAVRASGVAEKLVLEISERNIPDRIGVDAINAATGGGKVRVALDNVGATRAALTVLSRVNVAALKLDKSMTGRIGIPVADEFIRGLTNLAWGIGVEVIAEGVETAAQAAALRQIGIKMGQGWLYSHPISPAAFVRFHTSRQPIE